MNPIRSIFDSIVFISKNISSEITLKQCSKIAGMSVSYYIDKFKQTIGLTPHKYIIKRRLEISTHSLLEHNRILDIAFETGYESNEAYTRAFHHEFGLSPSKYQELGIQCPIEDLSDIEKVIVFCPAPKHLEYDGDLYYSAFKDVYDSVILKGYFDVDTLDYRLEAKQLTEKYSYEYAQIILSLIAAVSTTADLYSKVNLVKPLPKLLFYLIMKELIENRLIDTDIYTINTKYKFQQFISSLLDNSPLVDSELFTI